MRINLITVGSKMPQWVINGYHEYAKRLPKEIQLVVTEVPLSRRSKGVDLQRAMAKEAQQQLAALGDRDLVVALDLKGKAWSTAQLAEQLKSWQMSGDPVALLVGGPDGLAPECLHRADQRWSLCDLTFPHPLVRVIIAEQLYRAWSLLNHHPYHR